MDVIIDDDGCDNRWWWMW